MIVRRECCNYCMWYGPVNQDGTMRKHRPAREGTVSGERKIQDFTKPHCPGSNKPYARFGCDTEETTTVNDQQPTTARTAADLPKGTRIMSPEGRMGTVNGVDVGRVTIEGHPNYGREYVGVDWDAVDGDMGLNRRSRPFVDELVIESTPEAPAAPRYETHSFTAGTTTVFGVRDAVTMIDVASFYSREAARDKRDRLNAAETELTEVHKILNDLPKCTHGRHLYRSLGSKPIPRCETGARYGVWDDGAGGFTHVVDCAQDAATWAAEQLDDEPDSELEIKAVCPEHEEQPADGCEDCNAELEDEDDEDGDDA